MNKTYEKIKKLLALANSSNENEAKLAAALANKLMIKFNISMQEVKTENHYGETVISEQAKQSTEAKFVLSLINKFFFVESYSHRFSKLKVTKTVLVGTPENVEIASYVHDFLIQAFRSTWASYKKANNVGATSKQSFYYGLYKGLSEKFEEAKTEVETETGLVVVKDNGIMKWMNGKGTKLSQRKSNVRTGDSEAKNAGQQTGRDMNINRGIGSQSNSGKTLLIGRG